MSKQPYGKLDSANKPKTRVLVVDNDPLARSDLLQDLDIGGFEVVAAKGFGAKLLQDAIALAKSFRPHVAVVDLRLLDDYTTSDISGLELAKQLGDAKTVLYSANLSNEITSKANRVGFSDWVPKYESPEALIEAIQLAAKSISSAQNSQIVHWPRYWDSASIIQFLTEDHLDIHSSLVHDVIFQLLESTKNVRPTNIAGNVADKPVLTHGNSVVFKVTLDDRLPVVLKISSAKRIQAERKNYDNFINQKIPGYFHTTLLGSKVFWDIGGILYSFMGTEKTTMPTFSEHYHNNSNAEIILRPLKHFFTKVWFTLYEQATTKVGQLIDEYDIDWNLRERLKRSCSAGQQLTLERTNIVVEHPGLWLLDHEGASFVQSLKIAVVHGDFHGNNLFVDSDHTWAIDFERTGVSHILRDFIELEIDILTRLLPPNVSNEDFLKLIFELTRTRLDDSDTAKSITFTEPEIEKAYWVILRLRQLAVTVTKVDDEKQFWWALLYNSLYVTTFRDEKNEKKHQKTRAEIFAAVLCERLKSSPHQSWPPSSWTVVPLISNHETELKTYRNLEIDVQSLGDSNIRVQIIAPDEFRASENIEFTYDSIENIDYATQTELEDLGKNIGKVLFNDKIGKKFAIAFYGVNNNHALRIRLSTNDPITDSIPWEVAKFDDNFIALHPNIVVSRATSRSSGSLPLKVDGTLRILGIACDPINLKKLSIGEEKEQVNHILKPATDSKRVSIEWLDNCNEVSFEQAFQRIRPHVIHFIGHGDVEESGESVLAFYNEETRKASWFHASKIKLLVQNTNLRFALINCCYSGKIAGGIALTLVKHGVSAAIGMAGEITDSASVHFTDGFYEALLTGQPVDAAVSAGRRRVIIRSKQDDPGWAQAILYMSSPDGILFNLTHPPH